MRLEHPLMGIYALQVVWREKYRYVHKNGHNVKIPQNVAIVSDFICNFAMSVNDLLILVVAQD